MEFEQGSTLSLLALFLYFAIVVGIGIYYSSKANSTEDFILASHSLSTPFVTGSVVATWLGGAVIIGDASCLSF